MRTSVHRRLFAYFLATSYLVFALIGCAQSPKAVAPVPAPVAPVVTAAVPAPAPPKPASVLVEAPAPETTVFPGTGQFAKPGAPQPAGARSALADQEVSFNFEATPVPEVVKTILGDLLQETYVIGPGVGGTVTFATAKPIKGEQAMAVLEMLLSWSGAALVRKNDQYLVVQTQAAVPGNLAPQLIAGDGRGYGVRAIPLKYISATQMEELLKPYAKQGAVLKADNARSLLIVAGTKSELDNYLSVIDTFDVDWIAGMSFGMYTLERVEVKDLMPELEAIFGEGAGSGAASSPLAGMVRLLPVERLNAILVITPQPQYLKQVEGWIKRLDRGGSQGGSKLYVYDVQNVKATDLADRLNEIFNGQAAAPRQERRSTRGEVAPGLNGQTVGSTAFGQQAQRTPPQTTTPAQTAAPAGGAAAGKSLLGEQEVRITAVEDNNSLLISATPAQYEILKSAIKRLDLEPLQVKIEAKLLEVTLSNKLSMGVQWWLERAVINPLDSLDGVDLEESVPLGTTAPNATRRGFSGLGGVLTGGGGVNYIFDAHNARALVSAIQGESDTKILSSPTLMVLNNKEATINVGQQIQQNIGSFNPGVNNGGATTLTQFRDTGITLTVTPRVNPGGLVYLEIQQEQSTPGATASSPVGQKSIITEVAVQSGQTIFLGGLIQETNSSNRGGLPVLSKLPVIGALFGSTGKSLDRTETLILITPTVVAGGSDKMREVTDEYVRRFKGLEPLIRDGAIPPAPIKTTAPALRDGELLSTPEAGQK